MSQADKSHITSSPNPDHLASLIRHYWEAVDESYELDESPQLNAHARAVMQRIVGVPAVTANDALAALDWLLHEGVDLGSEYDPLKLTTGDGLSAATTSLVHAIRTYLAPTAA